MSSARLSGLDASFLEMETSAAHMHLGWVATLSAPPDREMPSFAQLREHIGRRLARSPRYRQKLGSARFGIRAPQWVDDLGFAVERHVYWAPGPVRELVNEVMSVPLRRDRPLWEIWICDGEEPGRCALVGKLHHCMVDGIAAVELGTLLLDPTPDANRWKPEDWQTSSEPDTGVLAALGQLAGRPLGLARWPLRALSSPLRAVEQTAAGAFDVARAVTHSLDGAPESVLNGPLSPQRSMARAECSLGDLRTIKRAYGTTINDVMLAAVAGAIRAYLIGRAERPLALKAMVPVSVRGEEDVLGNRISFVFCPLPCDEPDALSRLYRVHLAMSTRKRNREPEATDLALKAAEHAPAPFQHALARVLSSSHTFNLVVSNIPGPRMPLYLLGCPLEGAYPVVPLADSHVLSIGMTTVCDRACFGVYADRETLPDVDALAGEIEGAIGELLARTRMKPTRSGRATLVAVPDIDGRELGRAHRHGLGVAPAVEVEPTVGKAPGGARSH
jgi:WS/DGAT/MGAT family acyltransferase